MFPVVAGPWTRARGLLAAEQNSWTTDVAPPSRVVFRTAHAVLAPEHIRVTHDATA